MRDNAPDWVEEAMTQAPRWEPPSGFAWRVTTAARQEQRTPEPRIRRERLLPGHWWRVPVGEVIKARFQDSLWVLRQYLNVVRS
jgi:hypothetical protein